MEKAKEIISEYMPVFIMGSTELIKDYDLYRRFVKSYETVPEVSIDAESLLNEIRELAGVDQTSVCIEHEIEYKLGNSLCRMISEFDVSDRNELRKIVGLSMDKGITVSFLHELISRSAITLLDLPVTREELYARFRGLKMNGATAFTLVEGLSCGDGLSDVMRDELWMDFAPDWLTSYCEKINFLPGDYELEQQMKIMMTIAWFMIRERLDDNA